VLKEATDTRMVKIAEPLAGDNRTELLAVFAIPETSHEFFAGNRHRDHDHDENVNVELQRSPS
jgi:hypothetical protein